ncbi:hypothetical protein KR038_004707 [Drosophila bunnanda]|nr:hypothetical protein KR038_004707 [Drosophila bunnanda]
MPKDSSELVVARSRSRSTESSSTELRNQSIDIEEDLVIESHFASELDNRDLRIAELQSKLVQAKLLQNEQLASRDLTIGLLRIQLEQSEQLASEQAVQLSEIRSAQKASSNNMLSNLENTNAEEEIQAEAKLQDQLQSDQHLRAVLDERIQKLEEELQLAAETIVSLRKQLKETTMQAEVRIHQVEQKDKKRSQNTIGILQSQHKTALAEIKGLQETAEAAAQLRQDVYNLKEQLQSSQDLLEKFKEKEQTEQDLREEIAKKDMLFSQVTQELAARDEQLKYFGETLKEEHKKGSSQEHNLKLLQEQVERFTCMRSELEYRNSALEKEIVRLKHEV